MTVPCMVFEWDERKRQNVLDKHSLGFVDAIRIFDAPVLRVRSVYDDGEERWIAIGLLDGKEIAVIYTMRYGITRIIATRRAKRHERRKYYAHYPQRSA